MSEEEELFVGRGMNNKINCDQILKNNCRETSETSP